MGREREDEAAPEEVLRGDPVKRAAHASAAEQRPRRQAGEAQLPHGVSRHLFEDL